MIYVKNFDTCQNVLATHTRCPKENPVSHRRDGTTTGWGSCMINGKEGDTGHTRRTHRDSTRTFDPTGPWRVRRTGTVLEGNPLLGGRSLFLHFRPKSLLILFLLSICNPVITVHTVPGLDPRRVGKGGLRAGRSTLEVVKFRRWVSETVSSPRLGLERRSW